MPKFVQDDVENEIFETQGIVYNFHRKTHGNKNYCYYIKWSNNLPNNCAEKQVILVTKNQ